MACSLVNPVVLNEKAMEAVQAEKKVAYAKELRENRTETMGIAQMRSANAPAQAEAAAVPEMPDYQEDQETNGWYERNPWRLGFIGRGTSPRVSRDSVCVSAEELFDRKRPIEAKA